MDNSEKTDIKSYDILSQHNIRILSTNGNTGIANALNIGCQEAIKNGAEWVITMDQDSLVQKDIIKCYTKYLNHTSFNKIGALVPSFSLCPDSKLIIGGKDESVEDYMTSGSLINLNAYQKIDGFNEDLFIDMVDTDYGFRLLLNDYKIIRIGNIFMQHNIGNAKDISFLGKHLFFITNHNYIRRYYITRNLLWLAYVHGLSFSKYNHPYYQIFKSIVRLTLFENDKLRKLKSVIRGFKDYKRHRYGKY